MINKNIVARSGSLARFGAISIVEQPRRIFPYFGSSGDTRSTRCHGRGHLNWY